MVFKIGNRIFLQLLAVVAALVFAPAAGAWSWPVDGPVLQGFLAEDDPYSQFHDPRYVALPPEVRPRTECLADVVARMLPYWYDAIVPDLRAGMTVLVAAHGNSLRALIKHLDGLSEEAVVGLNIPTGIPLVYELDDNLKPKVVGGKYLDPDAAADAIAAVANQGR